MPTTRHRAPRATNWERLAGAVTGRHSWVIALAVVLFSGASMLLIGQNDSGYQSPVSLPASADSARVDALLGDFPDGDQAPVILVITRSRGAALTPADLTAAAQSADRMRATAREGPGDAAPTCPVST